MVYDNLCPAQIKRLKVKTRSVKWGGERGSNEEVTVKERDVVPTRPHVLHYYCGYVRISECGHHVTPSTPLALSRARPPFSLLHSFPSYPTRAASATIPIAKINICRK